MWDEVLKNGFVWGGGKGTQDKGIALAEGDWTSHLLEDLNVIPFFQGWMQKAILDVRLPASIIS